MERQGKEYTVSWGIANFIGAAFLFLAGVLFIIPYILLWGEFSLTGSPIHLLVFLVLLLAGFVVHELLHAVGFRVFGRVSWKDIKFGIHWSSMIPYASCKQAMLAFAYRLTILLPGFVLGLLPAVLGILLRQPWLTFYGALLFAGAGGDFLVFWLIRSVPNYALVRDHPTKIGCVVITGPE